MSYIVIYTISIFLCEYLQGQTIDLYEYNQKESITNCTHGLVSDVDTVVFKAKVDYSKDINIKYVYFQTRTKNESDFLLLESTNIKENCVADKSISCEHIDTYVVMVKVRIIAKKELSGARIRGVLITSDNKHISSEQQIFPEIAGSNDISGKLFIDGAEIRRSDNRYVANSTHPDVNFRFECESQVLPCLIQISEARLMKPMEGKTYVFHTFKQQEQLNITIKLALCILDKSYDTIIFNLKTDTKSSTENTSTDHWKFSFLGLIVLLPITAFICFILIRRKGNMMHNLRHHFKLITSVKNIIFRKTKDVKKGNYYIAPEIGYTDLLLGKSSSTQSDTSSQQDNVNGHEPNINKDADNKPSRETTVNEEIHTKPMEKRLDLRHKNRCMKVERAKDVPLKQMIREIELLLDAVEKENLFENKKVKITPKPDEIFPFPRQAGRITLDIDNNKSLSVQVFTENEFNDKCKCRKCQDSQFPSTEWVHLILIDDNVDDDDSIDLHIQCQTDLKENIKKCTKTQELVTCDQKIIEDWQKVLKDWMSEWSKVSEKKVYKP